MQIQIIQFIALFLLLLVAGVFWGPWLALHRSLHVFTKEEFLKITKTLAANLGRPMQILMPLCILFILLSVLLFPDKNSAEFYLLAASFCLMMVTLVVTITTELPIVNKIKQWTVETTPSDWESIRDKWVRCHAWRVFPALVGFGVFLLAVLHIF